MENEQHKPAKSDGKEIAEIILHNSTEGKTDFISLGATLNGRKVSRIEFLTYLPTGMPVVGFRVYDNIGYVITEIFNCPVIINYTRNHQPSKSIGRGYY